MNKDPHRYDDMLDMPHHVSYTHPQMPVSKRAAQFASFKALTGYDSDIDEASKLAVMSAENDMERETFFD